MAEAETHRRVVDAVCAMEDPYRTTVVLRYFEGLTVRELAERTGVPFQTARTRLRRGMAQLRSRFTSGAGTLVQERNDGLLGRLASTPISRGELVLGKWIGKMILGAVQVVFAMLVGSVLFAFDWGPSLPMIVLVMLGCVARAEAQALGIGVLTANVMAALGGCWWPIEITPDWVQGIQTLVPTGWTMDALHKLISFRAGAASAIPHVIVLALAA